MLLSAQHATIVGDVAAVLLCLACAVSDLRSFRVPNPLTFGGAALGVVLAAATGSWPFLLSSLVGLVVGFAALLPASALGAVGMGDVKLLAATGALVRLPIVLSAVVYTLLWGGLLALGYALARGVIADVLRNLRSLSSAKRVPSPVHRMPYALAIFGGITHAVASRDVPGLSPW